MHPGHFVTRVDFTLHFKDALYKHDCKTTRRQEHLISLNDFQDMQRSVKIDWARFDHPTNAPQRHLNGVNKVNWLRLCVTLNTIDSL